MFDQILISLAYAVLGLVLLLAAKNAKNLLTSYSIDDELTTKDNTALALSVAGYYLGVIIIFLGAIIGPDIEEPTRMELFMSIGIDAGYAVLGIVFLNLGRLVVDRLVLTSFSTEKEIIEDRNVGTGAVEFGSYIATALVIAGAISGEAGGLLSAVVFFALGQLVLVIFARFCQFITSYDLHAEIEKDNYAAGIAFGGSLIAVGIVLLKATSLPFDGNWQASLTDFGLIVALSFVVFVVARFVTDKALLPKSSLSHEIAVDQNSGAALIEASTTIGMASIVFFVL